MIVDMKQFVPEKVCLSCDGCCRFKDENSEWRPRVAGEERDPSKGLADTILSKDKAGQSSQIKTKMCHGTHFCHFFNSEDNTCGIYDDRPFDCQLYPFVLLKKDQGVAVTAHLNCPFIQEKKNSAEFDAYVSYLKKLFRQDNVRTLIQSNAHLAGEYHDYREELEEVFVLEK